MVQGQDLPQRCLTDYMLVTATGSMVGLDELVSAKAQPVLLIGSLISEEHEVELEMEVLYKAADKPPPTQQPHQPLQLPAMLTTHSRQRKVPLSQASAAVLSEPASVAVGASFAALGYPGGLAQLLGGQAPAPAAPMPQHSVGQQLAVASLNNLLQNMKRAPAPQQQQHQIQLQQLLQQQAQQVQLQQQLQQLGGSFGGVAGLLAHLQQQQQNQQAAQQQQRQVQQLLQSAGTQGGLAGGFPAGVVSGVQQQQLQILQQLQHLTPVQAQQSQSFQQGLLPHLGSPWQLGASATLPQAGSAAHVNATAAVQGAAGAGGYSPSATNVLPALQQHASAPAADSSSLNSSLPQLDGANPDADHVDVGDVQLASMPVAIMVTDWFLELDEHASMRSAVLWVLGKGAWYRLKLPREAYAATFKAFVKKSVIADDVCDMLRRNPQLSSHKLVEQLLEARQQVDGRYFAATTESTSAGVKEASSAALVAFMHDNAEYLSAFIQRSERGEQAGKVKMRIDKSRAMTSVLQDALKERSAQLLEKHGPESSASRSLAEKVPRGAEAPTGVEAGRENADMQEVASVVCALVSSVDEEAWREQLIGNTRRLLLPAAPAKVAAAAKSARSSKSAVVPKPQGASKAATGKGTKGASGAGRDEAVLPAAKRAVHSAKGEGDEAEEFALKDSRGKTWQDHFTTLVSRQVLQEVVAQVEKICACPTGVSACNPEDSISWAARKPAVSVKHEKSEQNDTQADETLAENKEMQDSCMMVVDFIQKFGDKWVCKLRDDAVGSEGWDIHAHMEWITTQLLAEAVHSPSPNRLVVDLHMWLLQMLVDSDDNAQLLLLTEMTWCEVMRELMLKRLQHKARRMLTDEQDLSEAEIQSAMMTLRMCALAAADEENAVETEVECIDVNWIPDHPDVIEPGGFVKPKGWRGNGADGKGKPDRLRGVGKLLSGLYMAKLCFKNGSEKILGTFETSLEAGRAWDYAVIRQYGGNVTTDCLNFEDSLDDVLLILAQGQMDVMPTAREPLPELAVLREDTDVCVSYVGVRGALATLHKFFADEILVIRALGSGPYENIPARVRWMGLRWLCDEATETDSLRQQVEQQLSLGKVMYNLEVQEKIGVHRTVIEAMKPDLSEMLGVIKTLLCLDARDHQGVLSSSLDASGIKDGDEADLKSPTARRGTGGRFVGKAAVLDLKAGAKKGASPTAAPATEGEAAPASAGCPAPKPIKDGAELTRDLDLSVIHQKLLQGIYLSGNDVEADVLKVFKTAYEKEAAAAEEKASGKDVKPDKTKDPAAIKAASVDAGTGAASANVSKDESGDKERQSHSRVKPVSPAAAAAAARALHAQLDALKLAERKSSEACTAGLSNGIGSRVVSASAHVNGMPLAPAAASTRAGMQLERGWLGSTLRTKALGRDRLNRQYWWFDWPQGWLAVEACPAEHRNIPGEKMQAPVPSSKSKPSRAKPAADPNAVKRPLSGAAAASAAKAAADAAAGLPTGRNRKRKQPPAQPGLGDEACFVRACACARRLDGV